MKKTLLQLLILVCILSSCKNDAIVSPMEGVWQSIGSGNILAVQNANYTLYDITSISCLPNTKGKLSDFGDAIKLQNDSLYITIGVVTYTYKKIDQLPNSCSRKLSEVDKLDPILNFEVFAKTVEDHYAFFDINNIAWDSLYKTQKFKIDSNSSQAELYLVLEETLELLNDNHGFLEATDTIYEELEQLQTEDGNSDELVEYGDFQIANIVAEHYLKEDMTEDSWLIKWGKMDNNIGYMQIKAMWLYADLALSESQVKENGYVDTYVDTFHQMNEADYIEKERQGVSQLLDRIMLDLIDTEALIIDIRFNGGGQDAVTFEILKRFNDTKRHVASQKLRDGDVYTKTLQLYIEGSETPYLNPTYVLTSTQTGSAAESFALATMSMAHINRIGSNTSGAMSTALGKTLPNGWHFALSNELFMDTHGNNYENIGVPPDYKIEYAKDRQTFFRYIADNLEADKQEILKVLELSN